MKVPTWSGESTWMTPMTESRFQSGAHIAERICCMRIDIPALEALVGLGVGGQDGHLLLHDHVHDRARVRSAAVGRSDAGPT